MPTAARLHQPTRQHMTEKEAVQKANEEATRHGWDLERYADPDIFAHGGGWELFYVGNQPGDWFLVTVNARTGAVNAGYGY